MYALPSPQLIAISGPDAVAYAQAQFCNDVDALPVGGVQLNAWLTPQGRIRALFHLLRPADDRLLLFLRGGAAADLVRPLRMFVLRLKATVEALDGRHAAALAPDDALPDGAQTFFAHGVRRGVLLPSGATPAVADAALADAWIRADIEAGLPWLPAHALEQVLPSWLDFAQLGAISHKKGCYPGQEIVARLYYRGGADKRVPAVVAGPAATVSSATALRDDAGAEAGVVLQSAPDSDGRRIALAVLRKELAAPGTALAATDGSIQVISTEWNRPI